LSVVRAGNFSVDVEPDRKFTGHRPNSPVLDL
jgi:hypothetical protein